MILLILRLILVVLKGLSTLVISLGMYFYSAKCILFCDHFHLPYFNSALQIYYLLDLRKTIHNQDKWEIELGSIFERLSLN